MRHREFAAHHFALHQISEVRQRRSLALFAQLEQHLGRELHTATDEDLNLWMAAQVAQGKDPNTVRFFLNMLRPYFRWAWKDKGLIDADRWLRIADVKPPRGASSTSVPKPYKRPEIKQFWIDLDESFPPQEKLDYFLRRYQRGTSGYARLRQHMRNYQTRAIVSLALYEGLRRTEILSLTVHDLHPDNAYLLVKGKRVDHRERPREVPYNDAAREVIEEWLQLRKLLRPRHMQPWLALQQPKAQRPMEPKPFGELLAKVGPGYELHRFRHTFATERLRAGMPLERLQRILGHASVAQTLAYTKLLREDLGEAMERSDEQFMQAVGR